MNGEEKPIHPYSYSMLPLSWKDNSQSSRRHRRAVAAALNVLLIKTSIARIGLTLARFTQPKLFSMLSLQVADGHKTSSLTLYDLAD